MVTLPSERPGDEVAIRKVNILASLVEAHYADRTPSVNLSDRGHFENLGTCTSWCAAGAAISSRATPSRTNG